MSFTKNKKHFEPQYQISLTDQVIAFLTEAIVEGRYRPGQRLVESELQRKFGISRTPIREAFLILQRNGLLTEIPRKGRFVRKISKNDLVENFTIRAHLEALAATLAVPNLDTTDINKMESLLLKMEKAGRESNFNAYNNLHDEFHDIFIIASKYNMLIEIINNLRCQTIWFRYSNPTANERSYDYLIPVHKKILNLFIKKDKNKVANLVKTHILHSLDGMLSLLELKKLST